MKALFLCALVSLGPWGPPAPVEAGEDVAALLAELKAAGDKVEPELVTRLADVGTREAFDALSALYEHMDSVFARLVVLRGFAGFDRVPGLGREAMSFVANVATGAPDRELRQEAVEILGISPNFGPAFLRLIVESGADDEVRIAAMEQHVAKAKPEDLPWYQELFDPSGKRVKARRVDLDGEGEGSPHPLPRVRELAFEALASSLSTHAVEEALDDGDEDLRMLALEELERRGAGGVERRARSIYEDNKALVDHRIGAARMLARLQGTKIASRFIKDGGRSNTPGALSQALADILVGFDDPLVNKKLARIAGKGSGAKLVFSLRASRHLDDPKLFKKRMELLREESPPVQLLILDILGERREIEAVPALRELMATSENAAVVRGAMRAVTAILGDDPEWAEELVRLADSADPGLRNGALSALGATRNPEHLALFVRALDHEDWSTRLAAARALEELHVPEAVGPIATRIEREVGRMAVELGEILWRLTAQPFGANGRQWKLWWQDAGPGFALATEGDLRRSRRQKELRRLKQTSRTKSEFFGVRIVSHSVVFVLDVSGSMEEETRGKWIGTRGEPRLSVAKREMIKAIESLEPGSFFNVITFSGGVTKWRPGVAAKNEQNLADARTWISRLGPGGGTNVFGALRAAFADKDVDTVVLLSDGEPSMGAVQDPADLRDVVARWRRSRDVVLHCISVGGKLKLLEWLAEDSGGTYIHIP